MKCWIYIKDNDFNDLLHCFPKKSRFCLSPIIRESGVTSLLSINNEIINIISPYIKTEKYYKRELHFKNSKEMGNLIEQYTSFRIKYNLLLKEGYKSEYYNELLRKTKFYQRCFIFNKSLDNYLMYSYMSNIPFDEIKLINNYLNRFHKNKFRLSDDVYNDFIEISDFILNNITGNKVYHSKDINISFHRLNERKDSIIKDNVNGRIDFIDENCIYDLKCTSRDEKYRSILQVLMYLCMCYYNGDYDIKYVKVINPILNIVHTIDIDDFGIINIEKINKLMFSEFLENKELRFYKSFEEYFKIKYLKEVL